MNFYILTLFPEMVQNGINYSVLKKGMDKGIFSVECINIRDFAENKHKQVDDYPYGGGCGMVMQAEPIYKAYLNVCKKTENTPKVLYMSPQGKTFNQNMAYEFSQEENLIVLCGHYEGVDERIIEEIVTDEISIGDYVLSGGELASMVVVDAVARLLPGVLGKEESYQNETFSDGLLEYPQYTRPLEFLGRKVPDVLLSGHHANIDLWRKEQSLIRTKQKRPDLLG